MGYGYDMGGWMWLWWAALIIGVLALIGGVVWAIDATTTGRRMSLGGPETVNSQARQILDERYARGELGTDEYRERLQTLGGH